MKKIKKIVAVAVAGVMMMSLAGCNIIKRTKESIGKTVLAKVGDTEITRADVDQLLYYQLNNYKTQYGEDFEENDELKDTLKETRTQALESLIQEKLMLSKAEELGVTFDDSEITTKAEEQIKQYKDYTGSDEEYKKFIEQYGYTEDTFLDYWKEQSKLQMVYEKMIEGVEATDDEIKSYYDEHISEFKVNPGADVKDLVFTNENTAEADAKAARQLVDQGKSLEDISKMDDYKEKCTYEDLGHQDYSNNQSLAEEFVNAFKDLKDGETSQPSKQSKGWYLITVSNSNAEERTKTLDEVKEQVKATELQTNQQNKFKELIEQYKTDLNAEVFEDRI